MKLVEQKKRCGGQLEKLQLLRNTNQLRKIFKNVITSGGQNVQNSDSKFEIKLRTWPYDRIMSVL